MKHTHIVIMAGGVGSRLYPVSTPEHPKQFIDLLGCGKTLIQLTCERFRAVDADASFWVVTSARYVRFVREQLPDIPADQIIAEPEARNTAPCIALACRKIRRKDPQANIAVTPADAYVPDIRAFAGTMRTALGFTAAHPAIVCVGIAPDEPNTGYGYIHAPGAGEGISRVDAFKEKPSAELAARYLAEGTYFWNAGIFVWNIDTIEDELRRHAPQISGVMDELEPALGTPAEEAELARLFPACEKISIDYAVMEKSDRVCMIPGRWAWSDLGSFDAVEKITGKKLK